MDSEGGPVIGQTSHGSDGGAPLSPSNMTQQPLRFSSARHGTTTTTSSGGTTHGHGNSVHGSLRRGPSKDNNSQVIHGHGSSGSGSGPGSHHGSSGGPRTLRFGKFYQHILKSSMHSEASRNQLVNLGEM